MGNWGEREAFIISSGLFKAESGECLKNICVMNKIGICQNSKRFSFMEK